MRRRKNTKKKTKNGGNPGILEDRKKKDSAIFLDKSITGTRCAETGTRGGNKAAGDRGRDSGKILCCDSSFCQ